MVRADAELGAAVGQLEEAVEVPRADRVEQRRRVVCERARERQRRARAAEKGEEDAPSEDEALMKKSRSGWLRRTSGSSERMGKSGSFGSLFSMRKSWKRFGVSWRVSLRPELTARGPESARASEGREGEGEGEGEGARRTRRKVARLLLELRRDAVQPDFGERVEADADRDLAADGKALRARRRWVSERSMSTRGEEERGGKERDAPCRSGRRGT